MAADAASRPTGSAQAARADEAPASPSSPPGTRRGVTAGAPVPGAGRDRSGARLGPDATAGNGRLADDGRGGAGPTEVYSKDYWDNVFEQVRRKPAAVISLGLLVVLYAIAIYAPFLANDRPLLLEATDRASYRRARTSLRPIALNFGRLVEQGEEGYRAALEARRAQRQESGAGQPAAPELGYAEALAQEAEAIRQRVGEMRVQLAPADAVLLVDALAALDGAQQAALAGRAEEAAGAAETLAELAGRVRGELEAAEPGAEPVPGETVALRPVLSWPVLEAITRGEIYFMGLWALLLLWPLWNPLVNRVVLGGRRASIRRARRPKVLAVVLLPLVAVALWDDRAASFETSPYKQRLTAGDIVPERVVFVPIPFGFAEVNDGEYFRPPTWGEAAEISEEGYYVRGARADAIGDLEGFRPPANPVAVRAGEPARNDPTRHLLGTDSLGRDLVARLVWGARVSLSVGLVSTVFLVLIGTLIGSLAGYHGGWVDVLVSRVIEIVQCFPVFFLILVVIAFNPQWKGVVPIMVVIAVFRWTGVARLVRGEFIRLRSQDFVVACKGLGVPAHRTIFRHVLPNALGPVLVAATFAVAAGILTESALSFLGFGIQVPIPSWGSLVQESRSAEHWWIQVFPGACIFLTVMLYNLLGEGVRDALDPRIKEA